MFKCFPIGPLLPVRALKSRDKAVCVCACVRVVVLFSSHNGDQDVMVRSASGVPWFGPGLGA